ncbi:SsgA family sporulation/cell division regulator [Streptomyces sp. SAI-229]|jgi:hypothetical protein|uniref:SsgA family sporulation/cell division regulator n=1 Tax=Streptomyces sp. SAI-229 TaxID=3377731 RepID=UPI003C7BE271
MNNQMPDHGLDASAHDCRPVLLTTLHRLFAAPESSTLGCRFRYSADDPFAVSLDLILRSGIAVTWVVSRDLLDAGTTRPSGEGDIKVWPSRPEPGRRRSLYLSLDRPDGRVTFEADFAEIREWLDRTYALVPSGSEPELLDWDALEASLLRQD